MRLTVGGFPVEAILDKSPNWKQSAREAINVGIRIKRLRKENQMLLASLMAIIKKMGGTALIEKSYFSSISNEDELVRVKQDRTGDLILTVKTKGQDHLNQNKLLANVSVFDSRG